MTETEPAEDLAAFLQRVRPGEVRITTVAGLDGGDLIVDLDGAGGRHRAAGRIPQHERSWRHIEDPAEAVEPGQPIEAEVIGVDWRRQHVLLSARACEDRELRAFLADVRRGEIVSGTVAEVRNFGVFVALDGEPAGSHAGFVRVPELSWTRFDKVSDIVEAGRRVTVEVLHVDTRRGQVSVSLKALQEDPMVRLADRVGEVVSGRVSKPTPIGVFVRVAEGVEGLLPLSGDEILCVGETVAVRIVEVDPHRRRFLLGPAPRSAG